MPKYIVLVYNVRVFIFFGEGEMKKAFVLAAALAVAQISWAGTMVNLKDYPIPSVSSDPAVLAKQVELVTLAKNPCESRKDCRYDSFEARRMAMDALRDGTVKKMDDAIGMIRKDVAYKNRELTEAEKRMKQDQALVADFIDRQYK